MAHFCFFVKGDQVVALVQADAAAVEKRLAESGFEKQFEEIDAATREKALMRFADIRNEEAMTEHAFATGSVFSAIANTLLK